jgi:pimeloyl-ACP methyl ester carboxylesterase
MFMPKKTQACAAGYFPFIGRLLLLLTALHSIPGWAQTLHQRTPGGKIVNAEFLAGNVHRPALLVLHGFLQTNEFQATQNIINGLSGLGSAVLGPNLSLGIPDRKQSMQCQAPHQNTFDEDLAEINFWVDWLRHQGYLSVILVGHSWGSQHSLGYADAYPQAPVAAVIAISLVRTEQADAVRRKQVAAARTRAARHDVSLQAYTLSYCKSYMASPESYLSYARWDDALVVDTLNRLQKRNLPVYVVIGSNDRRSDAAWIDTLRPKAAQLTVVQGANHFFSSIYEFELNDRLEDILRRIGAPPQP